jgi:hypothetical protein
MFLDQWNLKQSKEVVRLVDIRALREIFSSEWASLFPELKFLRKTYLQQKELSLISVGSIYLLLKHSMPPISYSKD